MRPLFRIVPLEWTPPSRPTEAILMTSATTVLGMLPLVVFSGSNDNIWNALAFTLIGGTISSTLLVLTVTPALYLLFERKRAEPRPATTPAPVLAPAGD